MQAGEKQAGRSQIEFSDRLLGRNEGRQRKNSSHCERQRGNLQLFIEPKTEL